MPGIAWSDDENDIVVKDYFEMLRLQASGEKNLRNKQRRLALMPMLNNRSHSSIDFKHQNISAVLQDMREDWLDGYKPRSKYQKSLAVAVSRCLTDNVDWISRIPEADEHMKVILDGEFSYAPPPPFKDLELVRGSATTSRQARKVDFAEQNERNRLLGKAGEQFILTHEKNVLEKAGYDDLASKVRWVSELDGDGLGYDILSFNPDRSKRLIEVKTTNSGKSTPFYITPNELQVSEERHEEWSLVRLWGFQRKSPNAFELNPPLVDHVFLSPSEYKARFTA